MKRESLFIPFLILSGLALMAGAWVPLESAGQLATDRNPFAIQRSAYGKLFARLGETTVDRVWHIGVEQVSPHSHGDDHDHVCGPDCNHDHGETHQHGEDCDHGEDCEHGDECSHSHSEIAASDEAESPTTEEDDDVFEYTVTDADRESEDEEDGFEVAVSEEDRLAQEEGYHCAMCKETELAQKDVEFSADLPLIPQAKEYLGHLSALKIVRTNPNVMSEAHVRWAKRKVESQLLRSYNMDPTHYGAYNSYHLFLTVHDFGGTPETRKHAETIARHTVAHVMHEKENPEPWLTAASAMMNVYLLKTEKFQTAGEKIPLEILKEYEKKIGYCLQQFEKLQEKAEESGVWDNLTMARQQEISERYLFQTRTFEPFPALIARREAQMDQSSDLETEVAEILSSDGLEE